MGKKSIYLTR